MTGTNWLEGEIRRSSRNRIIAAVLAILVAWGLVALNSSYLKQYFRGPAAVTAGDIERMPALVGDEGRWVKFEASRIEPLGLTEITVRSKHGVERSRSVSATYYAAMLGSRVLLVKAAGEDKPPTQLTGELIPMEGKASQELFKGADGQQLRELFVPMELHVHDYRSSGHWILLIVVLGVLGGAFYGWMAWGRLRNPDSHPLARKAKLWGGLDAVDQEVFDEQPDVAVIGGWRLGVRYMVRSSLLGIEVHKLDELLWAYAEVTKKKIYLVIPAGTTYALMLKWRGEAVKIEAKEDLVLEALQRVATHQPWIVFGWNKETETYYDRQRARFAAQVGQAKQKHLAATAPATEPAELAKDEFPQTQPQKLAPA